MGASVSVSRPADEATLGALSVDDVATFVGGLDTHVAAKEVAWDEIAKRLKAARVDGRLLVAQRSADVDGLSVLLTSLIPDAGARSFLVNEVESLFRRPDDEQQRSVERLRAMIAGTLAITRCAGIEAIELGAMEESDVRRLIAKRHSRVRKKATEALERLAALPPEDKLLPKNQGAIELYSDENQTKRDKIRESPRIVRLLEKWWLAAKLFCGKPGADELTKKEYAEYHKRLIELLRASGAYGAVTDDEAQKLMEEDFVSDCCDGRIAREDFMQSTFELTDQWTETVDAEEYEEFLKVGYAIMFQDLVAADKPQVPESMSSTKVIELVDGEYGVEDLETDQVAWLEAPDIVDNLAASIFDATDCVPDADELDATADCFEEEVEENGEPSPPQRRRRSVSKSRASAERQRRSSIGTARASGERQRRPSVERSTRSSHDSDKSTNRRLSPSKRASKDNDVRPALATAEPASAPGDDDDMKPPKEGPAEVERSSANNDEGVAKRHVSDVAADVANKVVIIAQHPRAEVLAKQLEKLQDNGAKAVMICRSSTDGTADVLPKKQRLEFKIPVVSISRETAARVRKYPKLRSRTVRFLQHQKALTPMPLPNCVESIAEVLYAKVCDDERREKRGCGRLQLADFVPTFFKNKFGNSRLYDRKYKGFLLGVLRELDDRTASADDDAHALVALFAQLCGVGTKSGRIVPLPERAVNFVMDHLRFLDPLVVETNKLIPTSSRTPVQRKITNGKAARTVGAVHRTKARALVHRAFVKYFHLSKKDPVYKVSMATFKALLVSVKATDGSDLQVASCPSILSLLAVAHSACDCPSADVEPPADPPAPLELPKEEAPPKKTETPFR